PVFSSTTPPPPTSSLFPYTTLFRSLADHFRQLFNQEFKKKVEAIETAALEALQASDWPGNVRELRNVIERAMIFSDGPTLKRSRSEEHTSELQSRSDLVCRLLLEKK